MTHHVYSLTKTKSQIPRLQKAVFIKYIYSYNFCFIHLNILLGFSERAQSTADKSEHKSQSKPAEKQNPKK